MRRLFDPSDPQLCPAKRRASRECDPGDEPPDGGLSGDPGAARPLDVDSPAFLFAPGLGKETCVGRANSNPPTRVALP